MSNKVGVGVSNYNDPTLDKMLDQGYGSYLIHSFGSDDGYSLDQAKRIRARYKDALVVVRIMGSMPDNADGFLSESLNRYDNFRVALGDPAVHLIPWNEPDLVGEGGRTAEQVAAFAYDWARKFKDLRPDSILHFPAFSGEKFYQNGLQEKWLPVAWKYFSVINIHCYETKDDPPLAYVEAFLRWWSTVASRRPNGKIMPMAITEWNHNPDLTRPSDYADRVYKFYHLAYQWMWVLAHFGFIWNWKDNRGKCDFETDDSVLVATRQAIHTLPGIYPSLTDWSALLDPSDPLVEAPPVIVTVPVVPNTPGTLVEAPMRKVKNVLMTDTKRDVTDIINTGCAYYNVDPVGFLIGGFGESNLKEKAIREKPWPDVSYGCYQPAVKWLGADVPGLDRLTDGTVADIAHNRQTAKEWFWDAQRAIDYALPRYAALLTRWGDPIEAWCRWNSPNRPGSQNPNRVNYVNAQPIAESYAAESGDVSEVWKLTQNHGPQRLKTVGVFIHCTRSGKPNTPQQEYVGTVNYIMQPDTVSAHAVVGPSEATRMVEDDNEAWHAGVSKKQFPDKVHLNCNPTHLAYEIVQANDGDLFTDFQYEWTANKVKQDAKKYGFPLTHVQSQFVKGIIGHEESEQGMLYGKSDPGDTWDWDRFMKLLEDKPVLTDDEKNALWGENAKKAAQIQAAADRLTDLSLSEGYTEQESLDESYRIATKLVPGLLQDVVDNLLKIKGS